MGRKQANRSLTAPRIRRLASWPGRYTSVPSRFYISNAREVWGLRHGSGMPRIHRPWSWPAIASRTACTQWRSGSIDSPTRVYLGAASDM